MCGGEGSVFIEMGASFIHDQGLYKSTLTTTRSKKYTLSKFNYQQLDMQGIKYFACTPYTSNELLKGNNFFFLIFASHHDLHEMLVIKGLCVCNVCYGKRSNQQLSLLLYLTYSIQKTHKVYFNNSECSSDLPTMRIMLFTSSTK